MRTPKQLYPQQTIMYSCEFSTCLTCEAPLENWHYLSSSKTVQTLHGFCQMYYLKNLAEPLSTVDSGLKVELRKTIRREIGFREAKARGSSTDMASAKTWLSAWMRWGFINSTTTDRPLSSSSKNQLALFRLGRCQVRNFEPMKPIYSWLP